MAEGTRMKQLEARLDVLELSLKQTREEVSLCREENAATKETVQNLERIVQEIDRKFNQRMDGLVRMFSTVLQNRLPEDFPPRSEAAPVLAEAGILPRAPVLQEAEERIEMEPNIQGRGCIPNHHHTPMPRLEIPVFEGDKPRWWIRRCERFFRYYQVAENQKVNLAAAYLNDMADAWFQGWSRLRTDFNWQEFVDDFCDRFDERLMTDVIKEFKKLKQEGSVMDYLVKFEELMSLMIIYHPTLNEAYFVSSFISGLADELWPTVKMMRPATVKQAVEKARLQELALEAIFRKQEQLPTEIPPTVSPQFAVLALQPQDCIKEV